MAPSTPNIKAAQAVVSSRQRVQKGLSRDASNSTSSPLSLREAEARYPGSKRMTIDRIVKKLEAAKTLNFDEVAETRLGRPKQLTDEDEEGVLAFVMWRKRSGEPASKQEVEEAANKLRRHRDPDAEPVGRMWYRRFRDAHPESFAPPPKLRCEACGQDLPQSAQPQSQADSEQAMN
ncbi:hypothetical protein ACHAPU_004895 [Fusarium lateritium]